MKEQTLTGKVIETFEKVCHIEIIGDNGEKYLQLVPFPAEIGNEITVTFSLRK